MLFYCILYKLIEKFFQLLWKIIWQKIPALKILFLTLELKTFYILKALSTRSAQKCEGKKLCQIILKHITFTYLEEVVGFDHEKGKADSVQYIPILSPLRAMLQHENVLGHVYEAPSVEVNTMTTYSQVSF